MCSKEDSGHGRHAQLTHVHADTFWLNAFLCILCAHAMQFYGTLHSTLTIMPQLASTKYLSHKISSSLITSLAIGRYKVPLACVCVACAVSETTLLFFFPLVVAHIRSEAVHWCVVVGYQHNCKASSMRTTHAAPCMVPPEHSKHPERRKSGLLKCLFVCVSDTLT